MCLIIDFLITGTFVSYMIQTQGIILTHAELGGGNTVSTTFGYISVLVSRKKSNISKIS
jgi:hypothetical protein